MGFKAAKFLVMAVFSVHIGLFMPVVVLAQGQQMGQVNQSTATIKRVGEASQYYLGESNELLIRVNIWGRVKQPGQYFVPATTDLITLISVAGGPVDRSRLTDVRVVRTGENGEAEVFTVDIKKFLKTGDKRIIPDLQPEDTVVIHGSIWQVVADVVQVIGQLATVGLVYFYFFVREN